MSCIAFSDDVTGSVMYSHVNGGNVSVPDIGGEQFSGQDVQGIPTHGRHCPKQTGHPQVLPLVPDQRDEEHTDTGGHHATGCQSKVLLFSWKKCTCIKLILKTNTVFV